MQTPVSYLIVFRLRLLHSDTAAVAQEQPCWQCEESDVVVINGNIHPLTSTAETVAARSSQLDAPETIL